MSQTKKFAYGSLVAAAALAFGVDQLFLGESTAPTRAEAGGPSVVDRTATRPGAGAPELAVSAAPFPISPADTVSIEPVRDLFALTAEIGKLLLDPVGVTAPSAPVDGDDSAPENAYRTVAGFIQRHRLEGVIVAGSRVGAVVDGAWIEVGDSVDQCPLLRVEGRAAIFQCEDGEARIAVGVDGPFNRPAPLKVDSVPDDK